MCSLARKLRFTDRETIYNYTEDPNQSFAAFNKLLCEKFMEVKDKEYRYKLPTIITFNEVYYQVTRICNNHSGEFEVWDTYLNHAKDTLGTRYASDLVFSMVYAVLLSKKNLNTDEMMISTELKKHLIDTPYFAAMASIPARFKSEHGSLDYDFSYHPVPLVFLRDYEPSDWKDVTNNFDQMTIRNIVFRYSTKKDKLTLIDIIEKQQDKWEKQPVEPGLPF